MITLEQLRTLEGKKVSGVIAVLNGFQFIFEDDSRLRISVAWSKFEPGEQKPERGDGKARSSGEGAG
jgi:hypothetical protein